MDGRWQRGGRWLVLAALWGAGLARGDDPAAASSAGAPVRVMSFNIRYGTAADGADAWPLRRGFLADTIAAFDPDILGTQETLADQLDFLKERFPALAAHGVGRDDGARRGEMAAILFRRERFDVLDSGHYWLSPTPEVVGSRGWDAALPRIVSWLRLADRCAPGSRPILVVNTHFDHRGSVARLESAKLLRTRVEADVAGARVVITGDFNAAAGSPPHASLFGPPTGGGTVLVDTFQSLHPTPDGPAGTFNGFDPTRTGGERIDWIGCSADWHVREAEIDRTTRDGRVPSDHFPVTAVLGPK